MRRVLLLPTAVLLAGCYTGIPLAGSAPQPAPGTRLVIELNDQGRVGMGPQLGSGAAKVEGTLVSLSDTSYVLGVSQVIDLYGALAKWQGERITIGAGYVRRMTERRFSMGRTATAVGLAAVGFVAFVATRSLVGGGSDNGSGPDGQPPSGT